MHHTPHTHTHIHTYTHIHTHAHTDTHTHALQTANTHTHMYIHTHLPCLFGKVCIVLNGGERLQIMAGPQSKLRVCILNTRPQLPYIVHLHACMVCVHMHMHMNAKAPPPSFLIIPLEYTYQVLRMGSSGGCTFLVALCSFRT